MKKTLIASLFAATLLVSQGATIHNGLLNYWNLDGNANDTAGSFAEATGATTDNGSVNGTVGFAASPLGQAGSFPGGAGNNITVADGGASGAGGVANDVDRTGSSLTLSVWVQVDAWSTNWQGIASHGEGADYRIARHSGNNGIAYAGGTVDINTAGTFPASANWYHIVATTSAAGATNLYINGSLLATGAGPANINASGANANILCIGCNPDNGREFDGLIDDLGMWDRALSAAEVTEIYQAGLIGNSLGAIPEPSSGLLGALAGLLLISRRRR